MNPADFKKRNRSRFAGSEHFVGQSGLNFAPESGLTVFLIRKIFTERRDLSSAKPDRNLDTFIGSAFHEFLKQ